MLNDRTGEFHQCVLLFTRLNKGAGASSKPPAAIPPLEFSKRALAIALDIARSTEMLQRLAQLARKKPLFDDRPVEVAQLTNVIKQDIFRIEKQVQGLQQYTKSGQANPAHEAQVSTYAKNVLTILNTNVKEMSGDFTSVLEQRQKNELALKLRQEQFLSAVLTQARAASPAMLDNPFLARSTLPYDDPPDVGPYDVLQLPDQAQQMVLMEEQQSLYLTQRLQAVESIEATINEVGGLFQQLASMVAEQGETIQRIDMNVEDISLDITGAQRELLKYYAHVSNNRWFVLKMFAVLIVFFVLWVLVS